MADLHPMRIGAERVTTDEEAVVRSPFDGAELGRVPAGGAAEVDAAVAAADAVRAEPMPEYPPATSPPDPRPVCRGATIPDPPAAGLAPRHEEFARSIAAEAAKPLKTARVE